MGELWMLSKKRQRHSLTSLPDIAENDKHSGVNEGMIIRKIHDRHSMLAFCRQTKGCGASQRRRGNKFRLKIPGNKSRSVRRIDPEKWTVSAKSIIWPLMTGDSQRQFRSRNGLP